MVKIEVGGEIDVHRIRRLVRTDEMFVGYPDGIMHPDSDVQNSEIAEILHDGSATIPARPFLYQGIESGLTEIRLAIKEYWKKEIEGKVGNLRKVGALAVGAVQRFVRGDYYRSKIPNAPETIRRKGSDKPLIDEGFMIGSTTFVTRNVKKLPDQRQKVRPQ